LDRLHKKLRRRNQRLSINITSHERDRADINKILKDENNKEDQTSDKRLYNTKLKEDPGLEQKNTKYDMPELMTQN